MELHNLNIERAILATLLFDGEHHAEIFTVVESDHFYFSPHQKIYAAAQELWRAESPVAEDFIRKHLKFDQFFDEPLLDVLATNPLSNPLAYCHELIDLFKWRRLMMIGALIKTQHEEGATPDEAIAATIKEIENIEHAGADRTRAKSFDELAEEDERMEPLAKYASGVSFLDDPLRGGFEEGQLILVGGDPEAGKTMLTTQILKHITKASNAIFFCFEFTVRKFVQLQKEITPGYKNPNLQIIDDGYDILHIEREIRGWAKKGAKVFVIDSQMRIENASNKGTVEERESEKFSRLGKLAHRLGLVIFVIIQTSKTDTASGVIAPSKSKNAAHEASIILYLKRVKDKGNNGDGHKELRKLIMSKNKQTGVHFEGDINFNPVNKTFTRLYDNTAKVTEYKVNNGKVETPPRAEVPLL